MKIVFLDFDGPLCNGRVHTAYGDHGFWNRADPVMISFLNRLTAYENTFTVLSTTWVRTDGFQSCVDWLGNQGYKGLFHPVEPFTNQVIDAEVHRKDAIRDWLNRNKWTNFLVVDDTVMDDYFFSRNPRENHVLYCDPVNGCTSIEDMRAAYLMLHGRPM